MDSVPDDSRLKTSTDPFIQSVVSKIGTPFWDEQQAKIKKLIGVAERLGTDVATLSMAWVLGNENVSSAITGASRPEQIYQTVKAVDLYKKLDKDVRKEIEDIVGGQPKELTKRFG